MNARSRIENHVFTISINLNYLLLIYFLTSCDPRATYLLLLVNKFYESIYDLIYMIRTKDFEALKAGLNLYQHGTLR